MTSERPSPPGERNPLVLFLAELAVKRAERRREIAERRANIHLIDGRASDVNHGRPGHRVR